MVIFGATSAIAQAVARLYAKKGARFFLVARNDERLAIVAADLRARGAAQVETANADLADLSLHANLVARAQSALGALDRVLVAHGTLTNQRAAETGADVMAQEIGVNFLSAASLLTHVANVMELQRAGSIAVIGSVAGDRGRQSNYVYGSAKAGLGVFVQGLRHRMSRHGVNVTLVKPGFVDTPMTAGLAKAGPLWATPAKVAADIKAAMEGGAAILYTPWFWRWIMLIIRSVPDAVFRRTRL
ncbi:MAG: SDR family oxidoreductase [Rhodospirillaceae bacterium]|nr:SDR family oxidoreductase [Rhodospirillaceae bacterium]